MIRQNELNQDGSGSRGRASGKNVLTKKHNHSQKGAKKKGSVKKKASSRKKVVSRKK